MAPHATSDCESRSIFARRATRRHVRPQNGSRERPDLAPGFNIEDEYRPTAERGGRVGAPQAASGTHAWLRPRPARVFSIHWPNTKPIQLFRRRLRPSCRAQPTRRPPRRPLLVPRLNRRRPPTLPSPRRRPPRTSKHHLRLSRLRPRRCPRRRRPQRTRRRRSTRTRRR